MKYDLSGIARLCYPTWGEDRLRYLIREFKRCDWGIFHIWLAEVVG